MRPGYVGALALSLHDELRESIGNFLFRDNKYGAEGLSVSQCQYSPSFRQSVSVTHRTKLQIL